MSMSYANSGLGQNKNLVNALLWGGAVLAIAGLWWPNWIEALVGDSLPFLGFAIFKVPVITYLGYIILWLACIMVVGLRGAASDYRAPGWVGLASVAIVIVSSILAQIGASAFIILLLFVVGSFLATMFIYWTMAKMVQIGAAVRYLAWGMNFLAFIMGVTAVMTLYGFQRNALIFTYITVALYTITWLVIAVSVLPTHYRYMMEKRSQKAK